MQTSSFKFSARALPPKSRSAELQSLGRFSISTNLLSFSPAAVRAVMRDMIVVRAEMRYDIDAIEYVGIHEAFDPVPKGSLPNEYDAIISENEMGDLRSYAVEWKRL